MDSELRPWGSAEWVTKAEAAHYLGVSQATIGRWAREDRLKVYKVAGTQSVRFQRSEVERLLREAPESER